MRPDRALLSAAWLSLWLECAACTHYVARGSDLYFQGRYIEAAQLLEQTEARLAGASPEEHAEYGLYRGATLLRLGDLDGALRWLDYSRHWETNFPGALHASARELLEERLIALRADLDRRAAAAGPPFRASAGAR